MRRPHPRQLEVPGTAGGHAVVRAAGKKLGKEVVLHSPDPMVFESSYEPVKRGARPPLVPTAGCYDRVEAELVVLDVKRVRCRRCLAYLRRCPQYAIFLAAEHERVTREGTPPDSPPEAA